MKKIVLIISVLLKCVISYSQDAHYTQFENSPFYLNPGSAGMIENGDYRANFNTRNQWRKLVKPSGTTTLSFDMPLLKFLGQEASKSFIGVGGYFSSAGAGDSKTKQTTYGFVLSGITTIGKYKFLGVGISAGRGSVRANLSDATWDSQYDGYSYNSSLPSNESLAGIYRARYWDFSTGINYLAIRRKTGNSSNMGISYFHLNTPSLNKSNLINGNIDSRFVFHFRSEINMRFANFLPLYLIPRILVAKQGVHSEIQAGLSVFIVTNSISQSTSFKQKVGVEVGTMYRNNDAIAIIAAYKTSNWKLGVSYDITISRLGESIKRRGGAELSFIYTGFNPNLKQKETFY